jgi:branched-chain amino acid transport system permease protein
MTFAFIPAIIQTYLPSSWGNVPTLLFGLGAIEVARHPAGFLAENRKNILALYRRLRVPPAATEELPEDLMVGTAK